MENQKSSNSSNSPFLKYQTKLNSLLSDPTLETLSQFLQSAQADFNQTVLCGSGSFVGKVDRDIIWAKKKILQELYECFVLLKDNDCKIYRSKIKMLTFSTQYIVKDGIINLYSDLSELRRKCMEEQPLNAEFSLLLEKTQKALEPVMRDYFMIKEIEKMDNIYSSHSLKKILSEKKIQTSEGSLTSINSIHSIKEVLSDKALNEISQSIQKKSIQQLIIQQLKGEEDSMSEGMETCRICKNAFKLKNLQNHVKFCSRIQANKAKRCEIIQKQIKLIQEMKKQISKDNALLEAKQDQLCFEANKIYKNIINSFDKSEKSKRRGSISYNKKLAKRISFEIDQYLVEKSNNNELLSKFRQLIKQRELIQKKLISLESSYIKSSKENFISECSVEGQLNPTSVHSITKSLKVGKMSSIKTKKSIFARKSESGGGSSDKHFEQLIKFQSYKAHMDQIVNSDEEDCSKHTEPSIRMHRSMSSFINNDELSFKEICVDDFEVIKFLGKGAFGKVYMVRRKKTKDIYALKMIKIQQNWDQKELDSIKNEHEILSKIAGEHLVKAPFSFTQGHAHFFVLQYMPGGDLAKIIEQQVYLDYEQSKFYLAEIVLAIEHLHEFGIIHRDLKPQNLVFDANGHLKLTDFGLSQMRINDKLRKAKRMNSSNEDKPASQISIQGQLEQNQKQGKMKSALIEVKNKNRLIGTPDYIAPQIINGQSLDNLSIDWWSLGVIAYEMMVGCRPFCANSVDQIMENILEFNIQWPQIGDQDDMIKPQAADFIKNLLNQDYKQRLGSYGIAQIKQHPFFEGICWEEIKSQRPPLMPYIDRKQKYENAPEISDLKIQIRSAVGSSQAKSSFKLQNFVRYDILVQQTLQSADKQIVKREARIKKLKSIQENLQNQSGEPFQTRNIGSRSIVDDQIDGQIVDSHEFIAELERHTSLNEEITQ